MNNLSKAILQKYYWRWIYVSAGLALVFVKQPFSWIGWALLNLYLFEVIAVLMTIPHELGHAIAARLMGMKVIKIIIGSGRTLFTLWEFKQFFTGGTTLFLGKSTHLYRLKNFLIILSGSLTNFLLILLALQFPQEVFLKNLLGVHLFPGIIFYLVNALIVLNNLFPYYIKIDGKKVSSDGLQLLTIPFLSKQEIARKVALSYVFDGENWERRGNHEQAIENFNEAIQRDSACIQAYESRGNAYQAISAYQKAVDNFNQLLEVDPHNAMSYLRS